MDDKIQEVLNDIRERLVRVETKIDDSLKSRLDKIEDNQTWLWRTVIGGFIAGVMAFIFKWGR
jgi:hypothetical protein